MDNGAEKDPDALMDQIIEDNLEAFQALAIYVPDEDPTYHSYHRVIDDVR